MLDGSRLSRVVRQRKSRKRSIGLTCHQACRRHHAVGPVAEVSTQEQCIALHPGSNPGRASNGRVFNACEFVRSKYLPTSSDFRRFEVVDMLRITLPRKLPVRASQVIQIRWCRWRREPGVGATPSVTKKLGSPGLTGWEILGFEAKDALPLELTG
jgi:hypothetical protein